MMVALFTIIIGSNCFAAPTTDESAELKQTQNTKKQLEGKIKNLNTQIDDIIEKVDKNKKDMNKIDQDIQKTEEKLNTLEEHSKEQEILFKKRLRAIYISGGGNNYLDVILGSRSVSDLISSMDSISIVMKYDNKLVAQLQEQKNVINDKKKDLDDKNNQLTALKANNESILSNLNNDIKQQNKLLADAKEKENRLIAEQRAREEAEAQAAARAAAAAEQAKLAAAQAQAKKSVQVAQSENTSKKVASNPVSGSTSSPVPINRGAIPSGNSSNVLYMEATAYSDNGFTASGNKTHRDPNGYSTIAVDPRVIPLGSKVYVEGYGYAIASDTGGAIKGNIIDLYVHSDSEALSWGRRNVKVHIIGN